jgi:hypothetical protein
MLALQVPSGLSQQVAAVEVVVSLATTPTQVEVAVEVVASLVGQHQFKK